MSIPEKYKFLIKLGKSLHIYGVPSYKIQQYLDRVAKRQKIKGSFMDLPTWVNYVFYDDDDNSYNYIEDLPPGELNLGGLSKSVEVSDRLLANELTIKTASEELDKIDISCSKKDNIINIFSFGLSALSFSVLFRTNWTSAFVAFFVGCLVGLITYLSKKSNYIGSTLESLVALVSTLIIGLLSVFFPDINITITIISAIIVFVPGLAIATSLEEITSKNLVSGTAKFFDSLVSLFKQFFGIVLGLSILSLVVDIQFTTTIRNIPEWLSIASIPILLLSFIPIFKVRNKDILFSILVGMISFGTVLVLAPLGILISTFIGAISVIISSKIISKITNTPKLVFSTMGIIMLVPGSKTFIGLNSALYSTGMEPKEIAVQIGFILMGIIGGLIFSGSFMKKTTP